MRQDQFDRWTNTDCRTNTDQTGTLLIKAKGQFDTSFRSTQYYSDVLKTQPATCQNANTASELW